jgi:hypothetical protein
MRKRLSCVLIGIIWLVILVCSFVIWPSLERMLLVKMNHTVCETANYSQIEPGEGRIKGERLPLYFTRKA